MQQAASDREFEIRTTAPARARRFYAEVFGWRLCATARRGVFVVTAGSGELSSTRLADVPDLDDCLERVAQHGGRVVIPTMTIRDLGWAAYVTDPDGNVLCLRQRR